MPLHAGSQVLGILAALDWRPRDFDDEQVAFVTSVANILAGAIERERLGEVERRATESSRLAGLGRIAAGVAHDLNGVLAAGGLYADLLETQADLDATGRWSTPGPGWTPRRHGTRSSPSSPRRPPGEGTGLGLAQVFGLVTQHGGLVDIDTTPRRGTTVSIWLPGARREG